MEDVQGITLTNLAGNSVPLSDIAQLTYKVKGMQVITIKENRGDSNCIAMTINTRKIAEAMASYNWRTPWCRPA